MYKTIFNLLPALLLIAFYSLPVVSYAQTAEGSGSSENTIDSLSKFLLDFENFDWTSEPKKDTVIEKKEVEKTTSGESSFLLDFEDFDWTSGNPASNSTTSKSIIIGSQTWSAANLDVTTFRNGDAIPEVKNAGDWQSAYDAKKPAWCYYENDPANGTKYGRIYNLYAITDARGLVPAGWHIPTKEEWDKLISNLPDNADSGKKLKGTGSADYAFVLGGYRSQDEFKSMGVLGAWWSSSKTRIMGAWGSSVSDGAAGYSLYTSHNRFYTSDYSSAGLSVRCVKD